MSNCRELEPLVTAYLDGESTPVDRARVAQHLEHCPPCREHARAESAAREVLRERARHLVSACAPAALHARCAAARQSNGSGAPTSRTWSSRLAPFAVAASLVLAVALAVVFVSGRSATVMAAQLTLDHLKCFQLAGGGSANADPSLLEASLSERYGWQMKLPASSAEHDLTLVTARRCLYGEGSVAHALYRHHGAPVSLYLVPDRTTASRVLEVMGHETVLWSKNGRSYVLVARRPRAELEALAAYVRDRVE